MDAGNRGLRLSAWAGVPEAGFGGNDGQATTTRPGGFSKTVAKVKPDVKVTVPDGETIPSFSDDSTCTTKRSRTPVVMNAIDSRIAEVKEISQTVNTQVKKVAYGALDKFRAMVDSKDYRYCEKKFEKVVESGRNVRLIKCDSYDDNHWLKSALTGRKHFPGFFVYPTGLGADLNYGENANGEIEIKNRKLMCGQLAYLYMKGHIGVGKKGYADCGTIAELDSRLQALAQSDPSFEFKCGSQIRGRCKKTHCFHVSDFPLVLNMLVQQYKDMPCGDHKVFSLASGPFSHNPEHKRHGMVIRLEKKASGILVIRQWDPNWTFMDLKIMLGHPDYAQYIMLSDIYTSDQIDKFFPNGVVRLTVFEGESDDVRPDLYWHVREKDGGHSIFEFKNGIWIRSPEQSLLEEEEGKEDVDTEVRKCIKAIVDDDTKSVDQKEEFLTFFIDMTRRTQLTRNASPFFQLPGLSLKFRLAFMLDQQDFDDKNNKIEGYYYFFDLLQRVKNESDHEWLARGLRYAVDCDDLELAKEIIQTVLTDGSKSGEEKMLILQGGKDDSNPCFYQAMLNGKHSVVKCFIQEILASDLSDELKVGLLGAKDIFGSTVFYQALRYVNVVDLASMYIQSIIASDLDISLKGALLSPDDAMELISQHDEGFRDSESSGCEYLKIKKMLEDIKMELNVRVSVQNIK